MKEPVVRSIATGTDEGMLVIGISSRALFDLGQSHAVFESSGLQAYSEYQMEREDRFLKPGVAFPLAKKLLALNEDDVGHPGVEVILLSRNSADTGLRIFNSIEHYGLKIERAAFTGGESPYKYMEAYGAHLLLSTNAGDVRKALEKDYAAATILPGSASSRDSGQLRIAFDGDAVIFGDEAERIYQERGLEAFSDSERESAGHPLSGGPFKPVLEALHKIQSAYPIENNPIRTALITARSAPAHKRVVLTLREWGIRIDEALFLGGRSKGEFLKTFGADIFFDDQQVHIDSARPHVTSAHVPSGVTNE
ncbi:MAG: 5'-nucleotidase [Xanthomonadales bacterium]|nr:5'-nucleotidase [Gammaproteobacteria bacterium]MBT8053275.1 5'-nucleotidase [Gammaproteobacteria bacterium]NND56030.1 5'-nucleotidase [Xanthomonadales bacterium]NNK50315.1 5'-nucleotidase [Xanthomonadales bacterium]